MVLLHRDNVFSKAGGLVLFYSVYLQTATSKGGFFRKVKTIMLHLKEIDNLTGQLSLVNF